MKDRFHGLYRKDRKVNNSIDEAVVENVAKYLLSLGCDSEGFLYIWENIVEKIKEIEDKNGE